MSDATGTHRHTDSNGLRAIVTSHALMVDGGLVNTLMPSLTMAAWQDRAAG